MRESRDCWARQGKTRQARWYDLVVVGAGTAAMGVSTRVRAAGWTWCAQNDLQKLGAMKPVHVAPYVVRAVVTVAARPFSVDAVHLLGHDAQHPASALRKGNTPWLWVQTV